MKRAKVDWRSTHRPDQHFYGVWTQFDNGKQLYTAYRQGDGTRGYFRNKNAWCIDEFTIQKCRDRGIEWITVIHDVSGFKKGAKKLVREYYATKIDDLYGPNSGEHPLGSTKQRFLSRVFWRLNPCNGFGDTAKKMAIGRVPKMT